MCLSYVLETNKCYIGRKCVYFTFWEHIFHIVLDIHTFWGQFLYYIVDIYISHSIVGTYVYMSLHREVLNIVQSEGHKHCTLWGHIGDQFSLHSGKPCSLSTLMTLWPFLDPCRLSLTCNMFWRNAAVWRKPCESEVSRLMSCWSQSILTFFLYYSVIFPVFHWSTSKPHLGLFYDMFLSSFVFWLSQNNVFALFVKQENNVGLNSQF